VTFLSVNAADFVIIFSTDFDFQITNLMHHKQVSLFFAHFVLLFFFFFSLCLYLSLSYIKSKPLSFFVIQLRTLVCSDSVTSVDNVNNDIISGVRNKS